MSQCYDESQIKVLKGLEGVRKRPSMYIGNIGFSGLHHLVFEIIDNAVDEFLAAKPCNTVIVKLHENNVVSVIDNGRGIPVGIIKEENKSALEVIMTSLHSGGKFDNKSYKCSAGLHGVGLSVVNALSEWVEVSVIRDNKFYFQKYVNGVPQSEIKIIDDENAKEKIRTIKHGTIIKFKYDTKIFGNQDLDIKYLSRRCRDVSFLSSGLKIVVSDFKGFKQVHKYDDGLIDFVKYLNSDREVLSSDIVSYSKHDVELDGNLKINIQFAFQYSIDDEDRIHSFVNIINTYDGGSHLNGFKAGLTKAILENISSRKLAGVKVVNNDVIEGLAAVLSIYMQEPE
ncbi:MAG: ATP-binding protein, partial [Acidithiobacillus sp.]|uniref:ATP-binding protein n=1 Tax=Acidithiobacillus sp. TaxID=1872118 RepID=UPI00355FDBD0